MKAFCRIFCITITMCCVTLCGFAQKTKKAPASKVKPLPAVVVKQADGTQLSIVRVIDNKEVYFETTDGYTVIKNDQDIYEYALVDINCKLITSGIKVHNPKERTGLEDRYLYKRKLRKHLRRDYFE